MLELGAKTNGGSGLHRPAALTGRAGERFHGFVGTNGGALAGSLLGIEGTLFDNRFRVEERIAEGGFAVVFKAWQVALERRVALKVLKAPRSYDERGRAEFRDKFAAEAKTIARLRHPHIVDVYDFAVSTLPSGELAPWMALEWLEGETLATHLARRRGEGQRGRDPLAAVEFLRPVMRALAHAHGNGIVHRDIKPSNIMVTETPQGSSLRVLDFGIAKIMVDDQSPRTGDTRTESAPVFSPAYAAPEQVAFSRTGPWTDVHALGLLLTEVMTDQPPFSDADPEGHFFEQVMSHRRPTPASKGRDSGPFEPLVAKALALSPRDRWRNAGDLLDALDAVISGSDGVEEGSSAVVPPLAALENGTQRSMSPMSLLSPKDEGSRARRRIAVPVALVVVAALSIAGVGWLRGRGRQSPAATAPAATAPAAVVPEAVMQPVALPAAATPPGEGSTSPSTAEKRANGKGAEVFRRRARQTASPGKEQKKPVPTVGGLGDGRDLFDDTK